MPGTNVAENVFGGPALCRAPVNGFDATRDLCLPSCFHTLFNWWLQTLQKRLHQLSPLIFGKRKYIVREFFDGELTHQRSL